MTLPTSLEMSPRYIVQPPGIGIPPIADMDAHQTIVSAALAPNSRAETPKKIRWEAHSEIMRRGFTNPLNVRHRDTYDPAHRLPYSS